MLMICGYFLLGRPKLRWCNAPDSELQLTLDQGGVEFIPIAAVAQEWMSLLRSRSAKRTQFHL